jgi:hypothetical protein
MATKDPKDPKETTKNPDPAAKGPEIPQPTEVTKVGPSELPAVNPMEDMFAGDAGGGFESTDAETYAIPFFMILQKGSPQCDEDDGAFIEGAKPGMLFNSVSQELYDGAKGVLVVPAYFQRMMVEWVPRDSGGGMRGMHKPEEPGIQNLPRDDRGRFTLPNGNYLADTRYHFCVLLKEDGNFEPVVISMSSTQIKKSRQWMTKMQGIKIPLPTGKKITPPMFSHVYKLTTVSESNDQGSWKGWKVELDHRITPDEVEFYEAAKVFKKQVETNKAQVSTEPAPGSAEDTEVPF